MAAWVWVGVLCNWPSLLSRSPPRYHKVGILVLFLHDISDVQLEFTKLNVYFKSRGGAHQRLHALAADLGCLSFCLSWCGEEAGPVEGAGTWWRRARPGREGGGV